MQPSDTARATIALGLSVALTSIQGIYALLLVPEIDTRSGLLLPIGVSGSEVTWKSLSRSPDKHM